MRNIEEKIEQVCRPIYDRLPDDLKYSSLKAWRWARRRLINKEGNGWCFYLVRGGDGIAFSLSKPRWSADHVGLPRKTGVEAIIMAVLEYENGF